MKTSYEQPTIRAHGHVESLTKGLSTGAGLDAFFPAGTAKGDLTFS